MWMRKQQGTEVNRMEVQIKESELEGDDTEQDLCYISRERSYTSGSLSDLGKKRKPESGIEEISNEFDPEDEKEPSHKRVKPVSKLKRFSQSIQRLSFRTESRPAYFPSRSWGKSSGGSSKSRNSKLWSETFDTVSEELSTKEIKRQEVIFELTQGEQALIDDLNITKKAYFEPMLKLCIMTEDELTQIFGSLYSLIPVHEDLLSRLQEVRNSDGTVCEVGRTLVEWLPSLSGYESYCCNLVAAKSLLDYKKQDPRVDEFLRLCQESSFSRKLDLWNFLDLPRSRLVKYSLLMKEILRHTPSEHPDQEHLSQGIELIQGIVAKVNKRTGESECRYYRDRLTFLDETQVEPLINQSNILCCHGELKNNKGAKLRVFLFERVLVITRPVSRNELPLFQVYRTPIPVHQLVLEDLPDGETRVGGSIRGAFSNSNERAKNIFRVSFRDRSRGQAHTLQANDTFNKQQWVSCIRQAIINCRDVIPSQSPELSESSLERIAGLSIDCEEESADTERHRQLTV